ncbi:MAG: penicillin-binding protein activator LpoB [Planctomycetota bacterium]|nr:MAG: penicillin-binding protein activator LpoB [Planctomycetota bacterium]
MFRTLTLLTCCALLTGCFGPSVVRGPGADEAALSTKLDRVDLEGALDSWYQEFDSSKFAMSIDSADRKIAILSIDNDTSEHIDSGLRNLIESFETKLVNDGVFAVVSNDTLAADAILRERKRSLGDDVDSATIAALGKEFGIHYFVHGRIGETTEKLGDRKRVQYYLFLKVTEVATTRRVFQSEVPITKQITD